VGKVRKEQTFSFGRSNNPNYLLRPRSLEGEEGGRGEGRGDLSRGGSQGVDKKCHRIYEVLLVEYLSVTKEGGEGGGDFFFSFSSFFFPFYL